MLVRILEGIKMQKGVGTINDLLSGGMTVCAMLCLLRVIAQICIRGYRPLVLYTVPIKPGQIRPWTSIKLNPPTVSVVSALEINAMRPKQWWRCERHSVDLALPPLGPLAMQAVLIHSQPVLHLITTMSDIRNTWLIVVCKSTKFRVNYSKWLQIGSFRRLYFRGSVCCTCMLVHTERAGFGIRWVTIM
jgi:hypothetical protein